MPFIDDNYLDGVLTRITKDHRDILMKTAKRLNLPDDDVLFLYIGAVEYTVQLCEDILNGFIQERQLIEQSNKEAQTVTQDQARMLIKSLKEVGRATAADIQASGMATTSAIAEANGEVLTQSRATVIEATQLKDQITELIKSVDKDRETNEEVLKFLLRRLGETTGGLATAIKQIDVANEYIQRSNRDMQTLRKSTAFAQFIGSFSPLLALGVAMLSGGLIWGWGMHMYWGEAEKYLPMVKASQKAFELCYTPDGYSRPGVACSVVAEKIKVKAKKK